MNVEDLKKPFPIEKIHWRVGATNRDKTKGIGLAYIDARDLYDRLDEVCGAENWQLRYSHANQKCVAEIGIKVKGEWVWKANGAGDTNVEADKGALSDAAKRAGVCWGIARYLYDMPNIWVPLDERRNITKDGIRQLEAALYDLTYNAEPLTDKEYTALVKKVNAVKDWKTFDAVRDELSDIKPRIRKKEQLNTLAKNLTKKEKELQDEEKEAA